MSDLFCDSGPAGLCHATRGDTPLYFDGGHPNGFGARLVAQRLAPMVMALNAGIDASTGVARTVTH